jgi:hypothetical protein
VAERIMSMKNSNDTIGNRTCDHPVCSAVSQSLRHHVPHMDNEGIQNLNFRGSKCNISTNCAVQNSLFETQFIYSIQCVHLLSFSIVLYPAP